MDAISQILVTYFLNALWQVPAIAGMCGLCAKLMRRLPVIYRHYLWVAAMLAGVLVPFASLRSPDAPPDVATTLSPWTTTGRGHVHVVASGSSPAGLSWWILHRSRQLKMTPRFMCLLFSWYSGFLAYRIGRLAWAYHRTVQLRHNAFPAPPAIRDDLGGGYSVLATRSIAVLCSRQAVGPFTVGIRQPVLVLPERFIAQASASDIRSAVFHELAHIDRHDFLLNLIYEIVYLPISFHFAANCMKGRVDQTRELVCDELAASTLSTRKGYARSLLNIAQSLGVPSRSAPQTCALGLFDAGHLEERVMNLLEKTNCTSKIWRRLLAVAASVLLAGVSLGISAYSLQVLHSPYPQFEGTWKAVQDGNVFLVLQLRDVIGHRSGSVELASFQMDLRGASALVNVTDKKLEPPIELQNIKLDGNTLSFDFVDSDGDDDKWTMDLTGANKANFLWVGLPKELKAKPLILIKETAAGPQTR